MNKRKNQVFAGDRHSGLILNKDGDLYVFGENYMNRFDRRLPYLIPFVKPVLLARNVKHAAIGGTAVIYVTYSGEVHMTGESEYVKRFPGFSGASKVYAVPADVYWIETEEGKVYGFGLNNRDFPMERSLSYEGRIVPKTEEEVIRWEVIKQEFECEANNSDARIAMDSKLRDTAHNFVRDQDFYKDLVEKYTKDNVIVYVDISKNELLSERYEAKLFGKKTIENRRWTYEAWVTIANNSIYEPVLCQNNELSDWISSSKPEHTLTNMADVSVWADTVLIARKNGEIYMGVGNVKKILSGKEAKHSVINRTVGTEWKEPFVKVCAGSREAVLLNRSGKLYVLGYEEQEAELVATNIADTAIGGRYIFSIGNNGEAEFVHRDAIENIWEEKFKGFPNAKHVYAKGDVFAFEDHTGCCYAFGYNGSYGAICTYEEEQIYDFGEHVIEVKHTPVYKNTPPYTGVSVPEDDGNEHEQRLKFQFMNTDVYRDFLKQYGENNVNLIMDKVKSEETQYKGWSDFVELVTYRISVNKTNSSIFDPVSYEKEKIKKLENSFFWAAERNEWKDVTLHPIRKAFRVLSTHWLFLCEDGSLILWNEKDGQSRYLLTEIEDMDMKDHFIISEKSGSVIVGGKEAFHRLAQDSQLEFEAIIGDAGLRDARRLMQ